MHLCSPRGANTFARTPACFSTALILWHHRSIQAYNSAHPHYSTPPNGARKGSARTEWIRIRRRQGQGTSLPATSDTPDPRRGPCPGKNGTDIEMKFISTFFLLVFSVFPLPFQLPHSVFTIHHSTSSHCFRLLSIRSTFHYDLSRIFWTLTIPRPTRPSIIIIIIIHR